jgi:ABC-type multidrug transport system ATPase subunit
VEWPTTTGRGVRVDGQLLVNGRNMIGQIHTVSAYVQQDGFYIKTLTVYEHISFQVSC